MAATHDSLDIYPVHRVPATRPFVWLGRGWSDLLHHRGASLAYGWLVATLSALILAYGRHPFYLATIASAFLLVGPLITAGVCELSRCRDHGESTSFQTSLLSLRRNRGSLLHFGGALLLLAAIWFAISGLLLHTATGSVAPGIETTVWGDVMSRLNGAQLTAYSLAFALLACAVFALSVVTVPMIIDRHVHAGNAMRMSLRVAARDLPAMLVWAALITVLVVVGVASWLLGMIVIFPLLGHATWYAYRDLVEEA
jgi:uncharacterized membrane protein